MLYWTQSRSSSTIVNVQIKQSPLGIENTEYEERKKEDE